MTLDDTNAWVVRDLDHRIHRGAWSDLGPCSTRSRREARAKAMHLFAQVATIAVRAWVAVHGRGSSEVER